MRFDRRGGPGVNYEPNSFGGSKQDKQYLERPKLVSGWWHGTIAGPTPTIRCREICSA